MHGMAWMAASLMIELHLYVVDGRFGKRSRKYDRPTASMDIRHAYVEIRGIWGKDRRRLLLVLMDDRNVYESIITDPSISEFGRFFFR